MCTDVSALDAVFAHARCKEHEYLIEMLKTRHIISKRRVWLKQQLSLRHVELSLKNRHKFVLYFKTVKLMKIFHLEYFWF